MCTTFLGSGYNTTKVETSPAREGLIAIPFGASGIWMDYQAFYSQLFEPVAAEYGALDPQTRTAVIGFDAGGPVSYRTVGADQQEPFVTCVTCELAVRSDQQPSTVGTYELLMTCNDESWCSSTLTDIAAMSLETAFDHGHTLDIGGWVGSDYPLQGIAFEQFAAVSYEGRNYGILRCHGIAREELVFAQQHSVDQLLERLRIAGIYPKTNVDRSSITVT
jgi:hypothetical protein